MAEDHGVEQPTGAVTAVGGVAGRPGKSPFADGAVVGIGALPHRDAAAAAAFSIAEFGIATVPSLP